jgi:hypothetical protein
MDIYSLRRQTVTGCIDYEVLAFDEAKPSQFIKQRHVMQGVARACKQAAKTINAPGLLSTRRQHGSVAVGAA